ncbi:MAG TPA: hypothetical protein VFH70_09095, partial [Acidimicrobiales bacterium]|nr:hypothetical protein [Acidimicrobiales bacterium]
MRGRIISEKQAGRTKGRVPVAGKPGADISTRREDPAVGEGIAAQFRDTGVVRVSGAFSPSVAEEMRAAVYRYAQGKIGLRLDDPSTWPTGWLPISWKGLRRSPQFDAVSSNDPVRAALDAIFGAGGWRHPRPGAQILLTLPKAGPWVLPDAWHMDCGFERATWPVFAVKMFAFFGEVPPMGGGTVVLSGTHRLVERYRRELPPGT